MQMQSNKKIEWIDYTKAFACFLVALGHLLQSLTKAGIDNNAEVTSVINGVIYLFHMPLFMCLSGYLYSFKDSKFTTKEYFKFIGKKAVNLLIPYLIFYILYFVLNVAFSSSVNNAKTFDDLVGILNNPMPPYWFLYALLSIFIIVPLIEKVCKNNKNIVMLVLIIVKMASIFFKTKIYFIDIFASYAIYFYLGAFLDKTKMLNIRNSVIITLAYYVGAVLLIINNKNIDARIIEWIYILFAILGIYVHVNIFKNIKNSHILNTFKKYTFQIFLMHTIFAAAVRILLMKLGVQNYIIHFIIGIIVSIYIPVIISIIAEKTKILEFVFYPIKTINNIRITKKENN